MKINANLPVVKIYAFESNKMSALILFYGNMVIIYELEDKMFCISKRLIDRDFRPVLYLKHEIQEYKNKGMT